MCGELLFEEFVIIKISICQYTDASEVMYYIAFSDNFCTEYSVPVSVFSVSYDNFFLHVMAQHRLLSAGL